MDILIQFLKESWWLTREMAPWLLLGFAVAGACGQLLPEDFIERHLSRKSFSSIIKAVFIGIPLPICSCGVIPVAASLRKKGASKGSVAAFTAATPQTGVDSIAATYSLMGWIFTLGRLAACLISGVLSGLLINLFREKATPEAAEKANEQKSCCGGSKPKAPEASSCCASESREPPQQQEKSSCCHESSSSGGFRGKLAAVARDGFITMAGDIGKYLVIGILLGALITTLVPEDYMGKHVDSLLLTYVLVTLFSVPLYVCATGSIPLAFSLLSVGISPGAAIVFLVCGPATNTATVVTLFKLIGKRETLVYIATLVFGAWVVAYCFDVLVPEDALAISEAHAHGSESTLLGTVSAIALILILLNAFRLKSRGG